MTDREIYIKTLLVLYRADEISLDKLWRLLINELGYINDVAYDNIEYKNTNSNGSFISECYDDIIRNMDNFTS